jgi:hypothetical protein
MNIPKGLIAAIMLATLTTGCWSALDGSSGNVPLSDLSTNPTVQIDWPKMTFTISPSNAASVGFVSPEIKVAGGNILIEAKYIMRQKPANDDF